MLKTLALVAVSIVALLHVGFLVLEMFLWTKPFGRRIFGLSAELATATRALAANQGLYNGFLAAGLIWGMTARHGGPQILYFFLGCVIIAGVFGGLTAKRSILVLQALPGIVAALLVCAANR